MTTRPSSSPCPHVRTKPYAWEGWRDQAGREWRVCLDCNHQWPVEKGSSRSCDYLAPEDRSASAGECQRCGLAPEAHATRGGSS